MSLVLLSGRPIDHAYCRLILRELPSPEHPLDPVVH